MTDPTNNQAMPSATADEAEIAAWNALPRDEQVRRYQDLLRQRECRELTQDSMDDVLKAARLRVREEVTAVYDAMQSEPERGLPVKDAFAEVRARHAARLRTILPDRKANP